MLGYLLDAQGVPDGEVDLMVDGDLKEAQTRYLGGQTPRRAMQTLGTEWGRALAPDVWVEMWVASIVGLERVVADDVRFENEVEAVRALGGVVVEVRRPGILRPVGAHASEAGVVADAVLYNNLDPLGLTVRLDALLR